MVHVHLGPAAGDVAVVTNVPGGNVGGRLTGSRGAVMAGRARACDRRVVHRGIQPAGRVVAVVARIQT